MNCTNSNNSMDTSTQVHEWNERAIQWMQQGCFAQAEDLLQRGIQHLEDEYEEIYLRQQQQQEMELENETMLDTSPQEPMRMEQENQQDEEGDSTSLSGSSLSPIDDSFCLTTRSNNEANKVRNNATTPPVISSSSSISSSSTANNNNWIPTSHLPQDRQQPGPQQQGQLELYNRAFSLLSFPNSTTTRTTAQDQDNNSSSEDLHELSLLMNMAIMLFNLGLSYQVHASTCSALNDLTQAQAARQKSLQLYNAALGALGQAMADFCIDDDENESDDNNTDKEQPSTHHVHVCRTLLELALFHNCACLYASLSDYDSALQQLQCLMDCLEVVWIQNEDVVRRIPQLSFFAVNASLYFHGNSFLCPAAAA